MLKIWFDVLTPKQLLFFESIIKRIRNKHEILFTSRIYREVNGLALIRNLVPTYVGYYGGGDLHQKLDAALERTQALSSMVQKFQPHVAISSCSPDASRVAYGLGIPHIGFSNSPHAEAVCRLSIPLLSKLLIPKCIPKTAFIKYGLDENNIIQYNSLDEFLIIRNKSAPWNGESVGLDPSRKTILFRTYETQAAYIRVSVNTNSILDSLVSEFSDCNIVVSGRYHTQIAELKRMYGDKVIVLETVFDSGAVLPRCDLLVGSGGTMTTEAVLRGVPAISYEAVASLVETYLVKEGLLVRAKTPEKIIDEARSILTTDKTLFKLKARHLLNNMEDPYDILIEQMRNIVTL